MKQIILLLTFAFSIFSASYAQKSTSYTFPENIAKRLSKQEVSEAKQKIEEFRKKFKPSHFNDLEFATDTFAINTLHQIVFRHGDATMDMLDAYLDAKDAWDVLLNKYYNRLMKILESPEQKEKLRQAQFAWLKFRDNDNVLFRALLDTGSISAVESAENVCSRTKKRAIELHYYCIVAKNLGVY